MASFDSNMKTEEELELEELAIEEIVLEKQAMEETAKEIIERADREKKELDATKTPLHRDKSTSGRNTPGLEKTPSLNGRDSPRDVRTERDFGRWLSNASVEDKKRFLSRNGC